MSLEKALEDLTIALGEHGCEFVSFDIDCPKRNVEELAKTLRKDCACDNVTWTQSPETLRCTISCSTITGVDDHKIKK